MTEEERADNTDQFEINLQPDSGRRLVGGAVVLGATLVLGGLVLNQPILVVVALAAFAVALYNYPLLGQRKAHLRASLYGLEIDGLGILDWRGIESLSMDTDPGHPSVSCLLRKPLEDVLKEPDGTAPLRQVQVQLWRLEDNNCLVIDLTQAHETGTSVLDALKGYHSRANL